MIKMACSNGEKEIGTLIPTRQSLLSRLKDWDDQDGWRDFFETYWRLIYSTAVKAGLSDAEAQDVVQETIISVSKSMVNFKYDAQSGSFKGWLLQLTRWRIGDQFRKRQKGIEKERRNQGTSTRTETIERIADPSGVALESAWDEEWERNLMEVAIDRVKKKVDAKHYQAFDLYVFKRWPVSRVSKGLNISAGAVYLIKHRVGRLIKKELALLQAKPAGLMAQI